jgi:hypothetical protein
MLSTAGDSDLSSQLPERRELHCCSFELLLDLQNNEVEDLSIVEMFAKMPNVKCPYLKGNLAVSKIKQCRYALRNINREDRAVPCFVLSWYT